MSRSGAKWWVVVVLAVTIGLHWAALQTVAWTTMFVGYAREGPLTTALVRTFDGQHPCKLCLAVRAGQAAGKRSEATPAQPKLDWLAQQSLVGLPPAPLPTPPPPVAGARWVPRREAPPRPPPRCA